MGGQAGTRLLYECFQKRAGQTLNPKYRSDRIETVMQAGWGACVRVLLSILLHRSCSKVMLSQKQGGGWGGQRHMLWFLQPM